MLSYLNINNVIILRFCQINSGGVIVKIFLILYMYLLPIHIYIFKRQQQAYTVVSYKLNSPFELFKSRCIIDIGAPLCK